MIFKFSIPYIKEDIKEALSMSNLTNQQSITLFNQLMPTDGFEFSSIDGVALFRSSQDIERTSLHYDKCILFVLSGEKFLYFNGETHLYNANNYVVLTTPMALEYSQKASEDNPLMMIGVEIDMNMLSQLTSEILTYANPSQFLQTTNSGLFIDQTTDDIQEVIVRLLKALNNPPDDKLMGKAILRELLYRILLNDKTNALFALVQSNTNLSKVASVIQYMSHNYNQQIDVETLAQRVNLSSPSLHRIFKEITTTSPKQYLKILRLHKARDLLQQENSLKVKQVAQRVGYESSTQFSREFSRLFGVSPKEVG